MLGLFKKRSALEKFVAGLSLKKRKVIMLALVAIYRANRNCYTDRSPLLYIDFYGKLLNINRRKISSSASITELMHQLQDCTELEKAGIILILKGLAHINHEANGAGATIINLISKELNFEFTRFLEHPQYQSNPQQLMLIFKEIIFPKNCELIEGGKIINRLAKNKLKVTEAEAMYISLAMNYELTPINDIASMQRELKDLGLCLDYEKTAFLYQHFKERFLKRLEAN